MKLLKPLLLALLLTTNFALGVFEVRWSKEGVLKGVSSLEAARNLISWRSNEEAPEPIRLVWKGPQGDDKKREVHRCEDYLELRDLHYRPLSDRDRKKERWFRFRCESLRQLSEAKNSSYSYLKDFRFHSGALSELPPCLGSMGGEDAYRETVDRAMESLSSWKSFDPGASVVRADGHTIVIQNKSEVITAEIVLWGDFNSDQVEDMLVLVTTQPQGLNEQYKDFQAVALTKLKGESFFRALGGQGEWACLSQTKLPLTACRWDDLYFARDNFSKLMTAKKYKDAFEYWNTKFNDCQTMVSEPLKLQFLVDLSAAAFRNRKYSVCEGLANQGLASEASNLSDSQISVRSLKQNRALCVAHTRTKDPKKGLPNTQMSEDGTLQIDAKENDFDEVDKEVIP